MARELAPPDAKEWTRRAQWFWSAHDVNAGPAPLDLDARAEALLGDLEAAFCVGAWSAVILLAWSLVEGIERARIAGGAAAPPSPDIDWLRGQRNLWAHGGVAEIDAVALRQAAEGAVRTAFKILFAAAWR
jgi:hypothetical protein